MSSNQHPTLEEQAAEAFLVLQEDTASEKQIEEALEWVQASAERGAAFARVERVWKLANQMPRPQLPLVLGTEIESAPANITQSIATPRRRLSKALIAVAAMVVLVLFGAFAYRNMTAPKEEARYATVVGEIRTVQLDDGSQIVLGGASSVSVAFNKRLRQVVLSDGEAFFKVNPNHARPFVVECAGGRTQAVGTEFDVHRGLEGVRVNVVEGAVEVESVGNSQNARITRSVQLASGSQVQYSASGEMGAIERVPAERILAWRSGKLIFVNSSLAEIAVDLNRYSPRPISIEGEAIKQLRFTGVVMTDRIAEFLRALPASFPLTMSETDSAVTLARAADPHRK